MDSIPDEVGCGTVCQAGHVNEGLASPLSISAENTGRPVEQTRNRTSISRIEYTELGESGKMEGTRLNLHDMDELEVAN